MMRTVLLGDVVEIIKGISYRSADYSNSENGIAFVNLKSVARGGGYNADGIKYYAGQIKPSQYVEPGDILIANTDLTQNREIIGSPIIMPDIGRSACFSLDLSKIVVTDAEIVDHRYLFYYLKSPIVREYMLAHSNGSTVMHLSVKAVPNMEINLPPLDQQKKIANILSSLDEKIELNRRMNEALEQLGQALFRHYFVDNHGAKDWENIYLGDIVAITTGKGSTKANLSEYGKYPLYGANGIMGRSQNYLLNEKVIVTGRVGTLGVVRAVVDKAWFSDNVIIMKPDPSIFGYVFYVVCGIDYASLNRGSTQPLITQTDLKNQRVKLPPLSTLQRFENSYAVIFNQIQANKCQMSTLVAIRDSLLPKLISGEIEI